MRLACHWQAQCSSGGAQASCSFYQDMRLPAEAALPKPDKLRANVDKEEDCHYHAHKGDFIHKWEFMHEGGFPLLTMIGV